MDYLVGHLVGDYILQNDWMALGKKTRTINCAVHVALYCASVWLFTGWPLWAMCVTAAFHFTQDRTGVVLWWMKLVGQEKFATGPCSSWSIIVVDNVFHVVQLYAVAMVVAQG